MYWLVLEQGSQGGRCEHDLGRMARVGGVPQLHWRWALGWWVGKVQVVGWVDNGCGGRSQMGR